MTYKIEDWTGHDRVQYFHGAYVPIRNPDGGLVVGMINDFQGDRVMVSINGENHQVPLCDIAWEGLTAPKVVSSRGSLYFLAPLGARTTRKPVTRSNLGVIRIDSAGGWAFIDDIPEEVLHKYLLPSMHAADASAMQYALRSNSAVALSARAGVIQCRVPRSGSSSRTAPEIRREVSEFNPYVQEHDTPMTTPESAPIPRSTSVLRLYVDTVMVKETGTMDTMISHIEENWEDLQ